MMNPSHFALASVLVLSVLAAGCTAHPLNGGSDGDDAGTRADENAGLPVSDQPLGGTIDGVALEPGDVQIDVAYDTSLETWFLTLRNYREPCVFTTVDAGSYSGPDKLVVTVGQLARAAGTYSLAIGDGHGASFQRGVYDAKQKPDYNEPGAGVLVLDAWSETAGATVTGGLHLKNDTSEIDGTFTATVCGSH